MKQKTAIETARRIAASRIIVHRGYPTCAGAHDEDEGCWCQPVVVTEEDIRSSEEIMLAAHPWVN